MISKCLIFLQFELPYNSYFHLHFMQRISFIIGHFLFNYTIILGFFNGLFEETIIFWMLTYNNFVTSN